MSNRNGGQGRSPNAWRWGKDQGERRTNKSTRQRKHGGDGRSRKGRR